MSEIVFIGISIVFAGMVVIILFNGMRGKK